MSQVKTSDQVQARTDDELAELASQLDGKEVSLKAHAGAKERLYGSITSADIAAELESATGIAVDKRKIELEKPIHKLGSYELTVKLGKDITPKIKVNVIEEEPPEEEKPAKKTKKAAEKAPKAAKKPVKKEAKPKAEKETKVPKAAKKAKTTKKETKATKEKKAAEKKAAPKKKTTTKAKATKKKEEK
jgi:outer membrane biosynthesis protein TonB